MRVIVMIRSAGEFTQTVMEINDNQYKWFKEKLEKGEPIKITEVDKVHDRRTR